MSSLRAGFLPPAVAGVQKPCASSRVACASVSRRHVMQTVATVTAGMVALRDVPAGAVAPAAPAGPIVSSLVSAEVAQKIESGELKRQQGPDGLEYVDIVEGNGATPQVGFQVVASYVAMTKEGRAFDDSIDKKQLYDFRVGSGAVVPGLDIGIRTMKSGGIRRLYIPGNLSFPNGLPSGPGRPRVPPNSPLIWDVQLLLVPGLDDE